MERSDRYGGLLSGAANMGRRQFLQGLAVAGAAAGSSGLIAGCSSSSTSSATGATTGKSIKRGGSLIVGLSGSSGADTLDPHAGLTYLDTARAQALYQSLVQLDHQGRNEYVLAENITLNSPTQATITLRQGVTFHSGKPLTAQDVIYTFQRILSKGLTGAVPLGPMDPKALKAVDNHTVQVTFTAPYASLVDHLSSYWFYYYIIPDGFNPAAKNATPDGTGPFKYQSFTPNQRSVFVKNPNFWQSGLPYVDTLTIIDFPDNTSLQDALTTGQIHAAGGFDGPELAALGAATGVKVLASHTGAITPFTMRVDKPPFNDVNVRQALRLLVNRPQLIDSALDGYGVVASDVFSPYDPDFDSGLRREQDIPQAKFLLKKAGFNNNLNVTLTTSAVATGVVAMATVLKEQAQAAGVNITLKNISPTTFFAPTSYLQVPFSQDFYGYSTYLAQVAQSMLKASPFNETHTDSPTLNGLYDQANSTVDDTARKQYVQAMQEWDFANGGYIIPAFIDALDAYSTKITGYSSSVVGSPMSNLDFEKWSFV